MTLQDSTDSGTAPANEDWRKYRGKLTFLALAALAATLWWGYGYWTEGRFIEETNDAYLQADKVAIAPKLGGYVAEVLVAHNARVAKDAALVRIDDADYRVQLAQAEALVAAAGADLNRAEAEAARAAAAIAQAKAGRAAAEVDAGFAESQIARYTPLAATGAATAEQMSQLANARAKAAAQLQVADAQVTSAEAAARTAAAAIGQAKAAIAQAEAAREKARLDLKNTVVRAPFAGIVGDRTVTPGALVGAGTQLMTLIPEDLYLVANFKETQVGAMRPGQSVEIDVDALPGHPLAGRIESLSPGTGAQFALLPAQNATGNFTKIVQRVPVRIAITPDPAVQDRLLAGLSVTAKVDTRSGAAE